MVHLCKILCPRRGERIEIRKIISILGVALPFIMCVMSVWGLSFGFWAFEESNHTAIGPLVISGLGLFISGIWIFLICKKALKETKW